MRQVEYRPVRIPVYAEMSSINPVFLLPGSLSSRASEMAEQFIQSMTMGAGQFCTSPGLVLALAGPELEQFVGSAKQQISNSVAQTMLTPGIHSAYQNGVKHLSQGQGVTLIASGLLPKNASTGQHACQAQLFSVSAQNFQRQPQLCDEVFGACALIIQCQTPAEMIRMAAELEGQLTATVHLEPSDHAMARELIPQLELSAGRIVCNGFPTGVAVCHAMVHGGPYPSTSDGRTTSVGSAAIERFLRPVCYQDLPDDLLPDTLKAANPDNVPRLVDGRLIS
jgi:NADP-dependent aldehyde dehydrogenase